MKELNDYQKLAIDSYSPPECYRTFYKMWNKIIGKLFFSLMVLCFPIAFMSSFLPSFLIIKTIFFILLGIGFVALIAYLIKHFHAKKYAKIIGLSMKEWNYHTKGMEFDV